MTHTITGDVYVQKTLHPSHCEDEEARAAFRREAALMKQLVHPNVLRFVNFLETEDSRCMYITTEFINGGSLAERINKSCREVFTWEARIVALQDISCGMVGQTSKRYLHFFFSLASTR